MNDIALDRIDFLTTGAPKRAAKGRAFGFVFRGLMILLLLSTIQADLASAETFPPAEPATQQDPARAYELDDLLEDDDDFVEAEGFPDPIEGVNRRVLVFNQGVNRYLFTPISKAYDFVAPRAVKFAIRRFFSNLNAPVTLANDLIQLEWKDAAVTTGAFVVNSTVGIAGFFEPAAQIGLARHRSDFGQTLALANVSSGPYLVVPFMGPTNLRDGTGRLIDLFLRPATWFLGFGSFATLYSGSEAIVALETHQGDLNELEKSSVDFYPVLRSAYYQTRMAEIWDRREDRRSSSEASEPALTAAGP